MASFAIEHDRSIFDSLQEVDFMGITSRAANEVAKFRELIAGFTKMQEYLSVSELVEQVLDKTVIAKCFIVKKQLSRKAGWKI